MGQLLRLLLLLAGWAWLIAGLAVFAAMTYFGYQKGNSLLFSSGLILFGTILILNILCELAYRNRHQDVSYFEAVFRRPGYMTLSRKTHAQTYGPVGCICMRLSTAILALGMLSLAGTIYLNLGDLTGLIDQIWPA